MKVSAALERVRHEWGRRIEAEYRSAALTQHFTLWLTQLGAPPDLLETGLRVARDELDHAALSSAVFEAAGGRQPPALRRESLALPRSSGPLEIDLLHHGVRLYCLGETVAVRLFSTMRQGAEQPQAREALDRILRDEVVHRDFGWTFLEWMLDSAEAARYRNHLAQTLPSMLKAIREGYGGHETEAPRTGAVLSPEARRWGLISQAEYAAAVASTFERDYRPLFGSLDVPLNEG